MGNILESIYNYNKLNENKKFNKKLNESFFDEDGDLTREAIEQIIQLMEKNGFEITTDIDVDVNYVNAKSTFSKFFEIEVDFDSDDSECYAECHFYPNNSFVSEEFEGFFDFDDIDKKFEINDISDVNNVLKYILQIEKEVKEFEDLVISTLQSLKSKTNFSKDMFSYCFLQTCDEYGIFD